MIVRMSKDMKQMQVVINRQTFSYDTDAIMEIASQIGEQKDTQACVNAITTLVNFVIDKSIIPGKDYIVNKATDDYTTGGLSFKIRRQTPQELAQFFLNMPIERFEKYCINLPEHEKDKLIRLLFDEYHKLK